MAKSFKPVGTHAVAILARLAARNEVKAQLKAQGVRASLVPPAEIAEKAKAYLDANPSLYEEALQRAWKLGLLKQADRIEQTVFDDERRNPRLVPDWRRGALFKTFANRPVCTTDNAKSPIENAGELVQPKGD
jgi:hypothetical protein